jgi:putative membrane protein
VSEELLRCHPSIIVENTLRTAIALLIILFFWVRSLDMPYIVGLAVPLVVLIAFHYRQWKLTFIRFGETDIVVERKTLFKLKKTIPYSRIASVNINRGVINRLFGTSKLIININSGYNAVKPEASLTFEQRFADRMCEEISRRINCAEMPSFGEEVEPLVQFTTADVILHGLFSVPTYQSILGAFFLANSVIEQYRSTITQAGADLGGSLISLFMFFLLTVLPAVRHMIYYYGFKVYRKGDTIFLQHGLIRLYNISFNISRINAIKVKNTLVSRLLGRSCIEAEVVGIGSDDGRGTTRPLISILKDDAITQRLFVELVPEFIYEGEAEKQPDGARSVLIGRTIIASAVLIAVMAYPSMLAYERFASGGNGIVDAMLPYAFPLLTALAIIAIVYSVSVSLRVREMDTGERLFTFVNGILDRETVVMSYDKVQMVHVIRGPLARRFGVASAKVFLLSSTGTSSISSGLFREDGLERICEIVMERATRGRR